jgi:hypothetical protein
MQFKGKEHDNDLLEIGRSLHALQQEEEWLMEELKSRKRTKIDKEPYQ